MDRKIFEQLCKIVREKSGINLKEGKEALVAARIGKRLRALGIDDEAAYLRLLKHDPSGDELTYFLDAISTNYTFFMRESEHFEELDYIVRRSAPARAGEFRIWCAAAATGEEPYSIAFTMLGALNGNGQGFKILATDISTRALKSAIEGRYREEALKPLTREQKTLYFRKSGPAQDGRQYQVMPEAGERIVFRRLNLSAPPFPMKGPFDVVFCRNVMIYFEHRVRQALVVEIERLLVPGGTLFTGHSETLAGLNTGLKAVRPSVYRKPASIGD